MEFFSNKVFFTPGRKSKTSLKIISLMILTQIISQGIAAAQKRPAQVMTKEMLKMANDARKKAGMPGNMTVETLQQMSGLNAAEPAKANAQKVPYFPKLNAAAIAGLPKKTLSKAELKTFISNILLKIKAQLEPADFDGLTTSIDSLKSDPKSMAQMAVFLFNSEGQREGAYIAGAAVLLDLNNALNINNFGAILNLSGKEEYAIPVLKSILKGNEKSDMLLNNIGQSFAGLGQRDSAMYYFDLCLKVNPSQPAARSAAAVIQVVKGNRAKAAEYLENSADEIPAEDMEELTGYVNVKSRPLFTPFKKVPDYFNIYKFKYPEFQTDVFDYVKAHTAQEEFTDRIDAEVSRLQDIIEHEQKLGVPDVKKMTSPNVSPGFLAASKMMMRGYTSQGEIMAMSAAKTHYDSAKKEAEKKYGSKIKELDSIYTVKIVRLNDSIGDGKDVNKFRREIEQARKELCDKKNTKANEYLIEQASLAEDFTQKQLNYAAQRFHFESKWNLRAALNEHMATANYYLAAMRYLQTIKQVNNYKVIPPFCIEYDRNGEKVIDFAPIFISGCQLNLNVSGGPISYKINCQGVSWSWTTFWRIKYAKNFTTKKSQVQIGIGGMKKDDISVEFMPGMAAGVYTKADANGGLFVDFDGKGGVSDAGFKGGISASASAGLEMKVIPKKPVGEAKPYDPTDPKSTIGVEAGVDLSVGINSGLQVKPTGLAADAFNFLFK